MRALDVELTPEQPPGVEVAVAEALAESRPEPDPWWKAGLEEALDA